LLFLTNVFVVDEILVIWAYVMAMLLVTCSQFVFLFWSVDSEDRISVTQDEKLLWKKRIMSFSLPVSTFGFFTGLYQTSDRWSLLKFSSAQQVGQYSVIFQLGYTPISLITGILSAFVSPILYQKSGAALDQNRNKEVDNVIIILTLLCLLMTFFVFIISLYFHTWIFGILVGAEFREASIYLPWAVLAGGIFSSGQIVALKMMSDLRPSSLIKVKVVTAVLGILANILGAHLFGLAGLMAALVIFSVVYLIWIFMLSMRIQPAYHPK